MGEQHRRGSGQPVELVFDPSGAARVMQVTAEEEERRTHFWMNEHNPTFLEAGMAVKQSEPCYEVAFTIDGNKRLLVTARNLKTGKLTHKDYPVIKLT